ncbi:ATP-binding protein [Streptomyces sp. SID4919]|uniref:ATP-binding protein n=1 Tax=unclassified Streptomyces TaxID=2593676 RepID=UPI000823A0C9|nr:MULTISPECIES: ATP-binding protein [unclassified Streptomyces]MYY08839.1 ATP-binding protein [Streptomyces sp. SID4919]SCK25714.1 Anti-sigma regulatory factor (Ser/Thr protein kinase) [Streptomyces sp. AmelKG-E11A]
MIQLWERPQPATGHPPALLLPKDAKSPRIARGYARSRVAEDAPGASADHLDTVALVVSELVTNAVRYGSHPGAAVRVTVDADETRTHVAVTDHARRRPRRRRGAPEDTRGRGLFLLAAVTARWGVTVSPQGKTVWAEVQR